MKCEYKRKEICNDKASRVVVSMTTSEAKSIMDDLTSYKSLSYASKKLVNVICNERARRELLEGREF